MKILKIPILVITLLLLLSQSASAQPTFQVYSPGATAGDYGEDQDTWFVIDNPFELWAIGAYHTNTEALTDMTLIVSVPEGQLELGSITIIGVSGTDTPGEPSIRFDTSFFPTGINFNNHYPLKSGVSDFLIYDLGSFANNPLTLIYDYNADNDGSDEFELTGSTGEIKKFNVEVSGFSWVHFDLFGLEISGPDHKEWKTSWEMAPGSHDVTWIPAPGAIFLGGIGVVLVGWLRRRRTL